MAIAEAELAPAVMEEYPPEGKTRLWTRDEYYQMAEAGILKPGERTELIQGRIVQKMSPMRAPHALSVQKTADRLEEAFGTGYHVREQLPLTMPDGTEPEPDVIVAAGTPDDYDDHHPGPSELSLLVEISDSTYRYDSGLKANLYAANGIEEYWVVSLRRRILEVRRNPLNGEYRSLETYTETVSITPLAAPNASVRVADLLPLSRKINEG